MARLWNITPLTAADGLIRNLTSRQRQTMGGFGGAIKNISIGIASSNGKRYIHSARASTTSWGNPSQDDFLESMAEAAKAIIRHCGENILYISVANNLSMDCDSSPEDPRMGDIGILASLDPVALDKLAPTSCVRRTTTERYT